MAIKDNLKAFKIHELCQKIYANLGWGYLEDIYKDSEFLPNLFEKKSATMTLKKCEKEFDGEKIVHCASPEKLIKVY